MFNKTLLIATESFIKGCVQNQVSHRECESNLIGVWGRLYKKEGWELEELIRHFYQI